MEVVDEGNLLSDPVHHNLHATPEEGNRPYLPPLVPQEEADDSALLPVLTTNEAKVREWHRHKQQLQKRLEKNQPPLSYLEVDKARRQADSDAQYNTWLARKKQQLAREKAAAVAKSQLEQNQRLSRLQAQAQDIHTIQTHTKVGITPLSKAVVQDDANRFCLDGDVDADGLAALTQASVTTLLQKDKVDKARAAKAKKVAALHRSISLLQPNGTGDFDTLTTLYRQKFQLKELSSIVGGIRLFNKEIGKGGAGITLTLELNNKRQFLSYLQSLYEDIDVSVDKISRIMTTYDNELNTLKALVGARTSLPKGQVYPVFEALSKAWEDLDAEHQLLLARSRSIKALMQFKDSFTRTLSSQSEWILKAKKAGMPAQDHWFENSTTDQLDNQPKQHAATSPSSAAGGAKHSGILRIL
ncbi:hypothetical protein DYB30_004093 [Aphanomyces astaci]|uniref:Cilia- and flagella-associated protein 206 n=1 Tax=Aphanomyces astaci TaxID=112090 RepID=A0A397DE32_APHAT|nr:hypothetical protein DYB34_004999 [Aphanomyces astaci]RHY60424.1 hypothetical protein DYB30_004093 [Aphanomyces astaci]